MTTTMNSEGCEAVIDGLAGLIDGAIANADRDRLMAHVIDCDACRDRLHDAREAAEALRHAGAGYVPKPTVEADVLSAIDARAQALPPPPPPPPHPAPTTMRTIADVPKKEAPNPIVDDAPIESIAQAPVIAISSRRRRTVIGLFAVAATIGAVAIGLQRRGHDGDEETKTAAAAPWRGKVDLVRSIGDDASGGLTIVEGNKSLAKGDAVPAGAHLRTDGRTRARIALADGTLLTLDRNSEVVLDRDVDRSARLVAGSLAATVPMPAKKRDESGSKKSADVVAASITVPGGSLRTLGGKLVASAIEDASGQSVATSVAVARGKVSTFAGRAGEDKDALLLEPGDAADVRASGTHWTPRAGLSRSFSWSELDDASTTDDGDSANVRGLGELRAHVPGSTGDGDKALRLTKQHVNVAIVGDVARTEIDETFASDEAQITEGVFRFPMPPGAQIERLALEVDGKLQEGAFVDREKGAAIWRGVMYQATPQHVVPKPQEQWVWVPGPWHDPALLEWKTAGRMELRIYPIPAHGSRRVVLAYTERIASTAGARRYVYPLPVKAGPRGSGASVVDDFSMDVTVRGHDPSRGVRVSGYDVKAFDEGGVVRRTIEKKGFVPAGDVVVELAKKDESAQVTTVAYQPSTGGDAFVAMTLSPTLPHVTDRTPRVNAIVVDSSRSMVGERWTRASALAARMIDEMDARDSFTLLACDVRCVPMSGGVQDAGRDAATRAHAFLAGITPDGASDLGNALDAASKSARGATSDRLGRIVYIGDGGATIGPRASPELEAVARAAVHDLASGKGDPTITTVAIGIDADAPTLEAIARAGGGSLVPYVPGQSLAAAALDVLDATYAVPLTDVEVTLPGELQAVAPSKIGALRPGEELLLVSKTSAMQVTGNVQIRGRLGGAPWSTSLPVEVRVSNSEGNSFVPRLYASTEIADLQRAGSIADRAKIVELSTTWSVPSKYTSLIVLESEAMASAFGVKREALHNTWTGNEQSEDVATAAAGGVGKSGSDELAGAEKDLMGDVGRSRAGMPSAHLSGAAAADSAMDSLRSGSGAGGGGALGGIHGSGPSDKAYPDQPAKAAMPSGVAESKAKTTRPLPGAIAPPPTMPTTRRAAPGHWENRHQEWYREVHFVDASSGALQPSDLETKITAARTALSMAPEARDKVDTLYGLLARRDSLDDAKSMLSTWTSHDPLDFTALSRRSELTARLGDRAEALRVATGALEVASENFVLADALADAATNAGDARLACALRSVHASVRPTDSAATTLWNGCLARRSGTSIADAPIVSATTTPTAPLWGDLKLEATWTSMGDSVGAGDLDLAVVDPRGTRISWLTPTQLNGVRDATSTSHEAIALKWLSGGSYLVEVTRASMASGSGTPTSGTISATILGQTHAFPLMMSGPRAVVGRIDVTWASRWVVETSSTDPSLLTY
jgi:hypothetical protein